MGYDMQKHIENSLIDPFQRKVEYVRLSVTDRCNMRCFYCLPKGHNSFAARNEYISYDEIETIMAAFTELGVKRIRITGGEPLVRPDLTKLISRLGMLPGAEDLSLSTNASLLEDYAYDLYAAGVSRLNVSLDSLNPKKFREITVNGDLDAVIAGLMAAKQAGFSPIKINMVLMKGINDDEVFDMYEFCVEHGFNLRFIETMPVGSAGLEATKHYMDLTQVRKKLEQRYKLMPGVLPGGGPARYYQIDGTDNHIGFITPISQHFCDNCNRVRLSTDGTIYLCLGQEHSYPLRPLLREGANKDDIKAAILEAIALKPMHHEFEEKPGQVVRFMSSTGG